MLRKNQFSIVLFCIGIFLGSRATASDSWHLEGNPRVVAQDIQFTNGDAHLAGTVYLPESGDHLPVVVALHGASDPTREAAVYRHLRDGLPAMGVAVLVYDRRGSGASSGTLKNIDYETLADDAIAGQNALGKLPCIDAKKIGYWGFSQGGWLAVLAAGRSPSSAFAISVSAPLVTPEQQMEFATTNLLTVRGYSQKDVKQMLETRNAWTGYLRGTGSRTAAVDALHNAERQPWFQLAFMPKASMLTTDPEHNSWRKEMDGDPVAAVRRVKVPLLFIYGGSDPWIPVAQSVQQLRSLIKEQNNIQYTVVLNANHEMMYVEHDTMAFDDKTMNESAPQAPEYFMTIASWLRRQIQRQ
jgi:dipeptidyl aminopeptidase/acylaminoacyl peptidase